MKPKHRFLLKNILKTMTANKKMIVNETKKNHSKD